MINSKMIEDTTGLDLNAMEPKDVHVQNNSNNMRTITCYGIVCRVDTTIADEIVIKNTLDEAEAYKHSQLVELVKTHFDKESYEQTVLDAFKKCKDNNDIIDFACDIGLIEGDGVFIGDCEYIEFSIHELQIEIPKINT